MKPKCFFLLAFAIVTLISNSRAAETPDLGTRVLFDAGETQPAEWQTAPGIAVTLTGGKLQLRGGDNDFGWAAPVASAAWQEGATVDIAIESAAAGQLTAQVEWLRGDGSFIKATQLLQGAKAGGLKDKPLSDFLPPADSAGKPRRFRLKFWLEGKNAVVALSLARVSAPRVWRSKDVTTVHVYSGDVKAQADAGLKLEKTADTLLASLEAGKEFSAFVLTDKVDYDAKGAVLLDLTKLQEGNATVQALLWDKDGNYIKGVDVLKDVNQPGLYEAAFGLYEDQFPANTKQVSFKVWLAGKETAATISGLYYGLLP